MKIKKSGLEDSEKIQDMWYVYNDKGLVVSEFFLPKCYLEDFTQFLSRLQSPSGWGWVCKKCYDSMEKEVECLTDTNWQGILCDTCEKGLGEFHVSVEHI